MLRYKTETRPGLVALYDIRPGNGAGQFLQPRSPHGAYGRTASPSQHVWPLGFRYGWSNAGLSQTISGIHMTTSSAC